MTVSWTLYIHRCGVDGCNKSYFTHNSLTSHMRSHHKEEELRCQWAGCGKKFDKPCRLKAHMRVHTGQRPFVCTYEVSVRFWYLKYMHYSLYDRARYILTYVCASFNETGARSRLGICLLTGATGRLGICLLYV